MWIVLYLKSDSDLLKTYRIFPLHQFLQSALELCGRLVVSFLIGHSTCMGHVGTHLRQNYTQHSENSEPSLAFMLLESPVLMASKSATN